MKKVYTVTDTMNDDAKKIVDHYIRLGRNIHINGGPDSGKSELIDALITQANIPMTEDQHAEIIEKIYPGERYEDIRETKKEDIQKYERMTSPLVVEKLKSDLFSTHDVIELTEAHQEYKDNLSTDESAKHITFVESKYRINTDHSNEGDLFALMINTTDMRHAGENVDTTWHEENNTSVAPDINDLFNIVVDIETHETSDTVIHYVKAIKDFRLSGQAKFEQTVHDLDLGDDVNLSETPITTVGQSIGYNLAPERNLKQYVGNIPEVAEQLESNDVAKHSLLHPSRGYLDIKGRYVGFEVRNAGLYTDNDIKQMNADGIRTDGFVKQTFPPEELKNLQNLMGYKAVTYDPQYFEKDENKVPDPLDNDPIVRYTLIRTQQRCPYVDERGYDLSYNMKDAGFFAKDDIETIIGNESEKYQSQFVAQPFTRSQMEQLPFEPMYAEALNDERKSDNHYDKARQISADVAKERDNPSAFTIESLGDGLDDLDIEQSYTQSQ